MKRTILSVAYPLTEVGGDAVGGSEQILAILDRAITEAGDRSLVIAAKGSKIKGTLIQAPSTTKRLDESVRAWGREVHRRLILETLAKYPVDLIHMHSLDFHHYIPPGDVPVLATLHLADDWYPRKIFNIRRRNFSMNCVSLSQHRRCPSSSALVKPVTNGVDVLRLQAKAVPVKKNFALAMGRICPEKGFHLALDAAHSSGSELLLAGEIFPYEAHQRYFKKEILPRLDKKRRFIGPLRFARKRQLLSQARCVMIPSLVAETSSLVAMEAIACGTPVIAFRSGALPETVDHGRTGYIVSDVDGMTEALLKIDKLKPGVCRRVALERFCASDMADRYFRLYDRLIGDSVEDYSPATNFRAAGQWAGR